MGHQSPGQNFSLGREGLASAFSIWHHLTSLPIHWCQLYGVETTKILSQLQLVCALLIIILTKFCTLLQQQQRPFYGRLSMTTRVSRYQKKHSPTHHPDHHPIFISFFHLPRSIYSLFKLRAWQSFCTTSFHVLFGLPLDLEPSTSYFIHFFTQSVSSFRSTCPYHRDLFCCSVNIISSIPSLSLNSLLGTLSFTVTLHIHLTTLISARWSAISFSFLTGHVANLTISKYEIMLGKSNISTTTHWLTYTVTDAHFVGERG